LARGEDKLVDGRDLAIEDEKLRAEDESLAWRGAERFELGFEQELAELPARVTTQHEDQEHRTLVLGVMRAILEGQKVVVELLQLPQRELKALEALQEATRAKDFQLEQFVYAADRRDLLEQALGVLQPTLLTGDPNEYALGGDLDTVTKHVAALRTDLIAKEDAQDELLVDKELVVKAKGGDEEGDDEADDEGGDEEGDAAPSTLSQGPAIAEPATPPSSLGKGPAVIEPAKPPSSLGHEDKS
jgi:hypothetical protein